MPWLLRVFGTEVVRLLAWTEPASRKKKRPPKWRPLVFVRSCSAR